MAISKDFVWGTATAAYQIEGAWNEDGRGCSVWDDFSHAQGHIVDKSTGDVACDHYHRWEKDLDLCKDLGTNGYRFSLSWTRLFPDGTGALNKKGADFYSRLIDGLLARGIEPFITLHHWDYPTELFYKGGWLNRDSADWFADYAAAVVRLYGDRVKNFITINEPQVILGCGYDNEEHAPGLRMDDKYRVRILHHILLAHGKAAKVIHAHKGLRASIAPNSKIYMPLTETEENIAAARRATFSLEHHDYLWSEHCYIDPIVFGDYPEDYKKMFADILPKGWENDRKIISEPIDFLCQNMYDGRYVSAEGGGSKIAESPFGAAHTDMGWPVTPEILYWGIRFLSERYNLPVYITENGCAMPDLITPERKVHDGARIEYMRRYLTCLKRAADEGYLVKGYFYWSLLDNFEWAHGDTKRFGLVYIDYRTQERIKKDSFAFYRSVIAENEKNL